MIDTKQVKTKSGRYELLGHIAYNAHVKSLGEHEYASWSSLVWAEQLAWCEAARAVSNWIKVHDNETG